MGLHGTLAGNMSGECGGSSFAGRLGPVTRRAQNLKIGFAVIVAGHHVVDVVAGRQTGATQNRPATTSTASTASAAATVSGQDPTAQRGPAGG